MKNILVSSLLLSVALCSASLVSGCSESKGLSGRETGALGGGALGAGLGAIIGHATGNTGAGIAIGAGAGALTGGLVGNESDVQDSRKEEQDERLRRQEEELQRQKEEIREMRRRQGDYVPEDTPRRRYNDSNRYDYDSGRSSNDTFKR